MAKSAGTQDRELRKRRMAVAAALLAFAGIVGVLALLFGRVAFSSRWSAWGRLRPWCSACWSFCKR